MTCCRSYRPYLWLAFLRGELQPQLARVLEHNGQEVVTLVRPGDHLVKGDAMHARLR